VKLKNGVSLVHIYLRRSTNVVPIQTTSDAQSASAIQLPRPSDSIAIIHPSSASGYIQSSVDLSSPGAIPSLSTSGRPDYISIMKEYQAASSGETGFETDRTEDTSASSQTESASYASSISDHFSLSSQKVSKSLSLSICHLFDLVCKACLGHCARRTIRRSSTIRTS
jgi:hypothetical protein